MATPFGLGLARAEVWTDLRSPRSGDRRVSSAAQGRAFVAGLWLSLAIIFIHAIAPTPTPWRVSYGSAFNGFTRDVSLGPSRTTPIQKEPRASERGDDRAGFAGDRVAIAVFLPRLTALDLASRRVRLDPARIDGPPTSRIVQPHRARAPPLT